MLVIPVWKVQKELTSSSELPGIVTLISRKSMTKLIIQLVSDVDIVKTRLNILLSQTNLFFIFL